MKRKRRTSSSHIPIVYLLVSMFYPSPYIFYYDGPCDVLRYSIQNRIKFAISLRLHTLYRCPGGARNDDATCVQ